jgi:hypothetical protein
MIVALCTEHKFLQSTSTMMPKQAARTYPIALLDVAKKAKEASSKHIILEFQCLACVHCVSISVKCTFFNIKYHWLALIAAQQLGLCLRTGIMYEMP